RPALICVISFCHFFFSSRRRHTRWPRDWSSDVCSSDLSAGELPAQWRDALAAYQAHPLRVSESFVVTIPHPGVWVSAQAHEPMRSEERRVGKEGRTWWAPLPVKK